MKILFLIFIFIQISILAPSQCPNAGEDKDTTICPMAGPVDLLPLLGGTPDAGGTWYPFLFYDSYYGACADGEGIFTYVVQKTGCPNDSSTLTINWSWDPCYWLYELATCKWTPAGDPQSYLDDIWLITLPPLARPNDGLTYSIKSKTAIVTPDSGYFDNRTILTVQFLPNLSNYDTVFTISDGVCHGCSFDFIIYDMIEYCACKPPPNAGENNSFFLGADAVPFDLRNCLMGNPDLHGSWSPPLSSGGNIYDPILDGGGQFTYIVSAYNCADDSATVTIGIILAKDHIFVPTVFSPNGDGVNDILTILADMSVVWIESFETFSRWGEVVYSMKGFYPGENHFGWDGTMRNKNLTQGVFVYRLLATDKIGNMIFKRGDITLLR